MFDRKQREVLGKLSLAIWGSESKWKKLYDRGALDVADVKEVEEKVDQVQVNNSKKGRGTIYNVKTAPEKVLKSLGDIPETVKVNKYTRRKPSFQEAVDALSDLARSVLYSYLNPAQLVNVLAVDFNHNENMKLNLVKEDTENYKKDLEDLLSTLPGDVREKLDLFNEGIPVDAVEFVSELIFVRNHPAQAREIYDSNLDLAQTLHKENMRKADMKKRIGA